MLGASRKHQAHSHWLSLCCGLTRYFRFLKSWKWRLLSSFLAVKWRSSLISVIWVSCWASTWTCWMMKARSIMKTYKPAWFYSVLKSVFCKWNPAKNSWFSRLFSEFNFFWCKELSRKKRVFIAPLFHDSFADVENNQRVSRRIERNSLSVQFDEWVWNEVCIFTVYIYYIYSIWTLHFLHKHIWTLHFLHKHIWTLHFLHKHIWTLHFLHKHIWTLHFLHKHIWILDFL